MTTIGECIGGSADGVQMDPPYPEEPDDWPDLIVMETKATGAKDQYYNTFKPIVRGEVKVYRFLHDSLMDAESEQGQTET